MQYTVELVNSSMVNSDIDLTQTLPQGPGTANDNLLDITQIFAYNSDKKPSVWVEKIALCPARPQYFKFSLPHA